MRRQIEARKKTILAIGAYNGWGGMIYTLTHLSALWNDPALLEEAEEFVRLITPDLIERDESLDIIGGSAGCIGCLVAYNRFYPSSYAVAAAIQCGDHLIKRSKPLKKGIGWSSMMTRDNEALTGFSHGAAGMAWALLELFSVTGNERFRKAAFNAMEYERSVFSSEASNWPDFRDFDQKKQPPKDVKPSFMSAWCHGAPGIGLGRLSSYRHYLDGQIKNEIEVAIKTTIEKGFGTNHSLCHGSLGNLETLLYACENYDSSWRKQVDRISFGILDSIEKKGWLCGVPLGTETPGLMCGLAGIGYELLRLAEPKKVPSILILQPPFLKSLTNWEP
jgi:type 2 lantibiotic biosynthesis protein LanM